MGNESKSSWIFYQWWSSTHDDHFAMRVVSPFINYRCCEKKINSFKLSLDRPWVRGRAGVIAIVLVTAAWLFPFPFVISFRERHSPVLAPFTNATSMTITDTHMDIMMIKPVREPKWNALLSNYKLSCPIKTILELLSLPSDTLHCVKGGLSVILSVQCFSSLVWRADVSKCVISTMHNISVQTDTWRMHSVQSAGPTA